MPITDGHVRAAMDVVDTTTGVVAGLRAAEHLAITASRSTDPAAAAADLRARIVAPGGGAGDDQLAVIAAVHALSAVDDECAVDVLTAALFDDRWFVSEHAAWALSARHAHRPAIARLVQIVAAGGFRAMLAQRTLGCWAPTAAGDVHDAVVAALTRSSSAGDRTRLVDTLGLVVGTPSLDRLVEVAADPGEWPDVRIAAAAALGDRSDGDSRLLAQLAAGDDDLALHALLGLADRAMPTGAEVTAGRDSLQIAQLYLHADGALVRAGAGDNGGIATLLALLSSCLVELPDVGGVVTMARGSAGDALRDVWSAQDGEQFAAVPFGPPESVDIRSAWPYRIAVERGIRRVLAGDRRPHVVHLRLADVGTLGAATVARRLAIPTVFTAAPDPHVVVRVLEADGALSRENFGDADELEHWWFRARMVERLTSQADRIALLPRPAVRKDLRELLGHDIDDTPDRSAVIPEGVHARRVRAPARAVAEAARGSAPPGLDRLVDAVRRLPPGRHGLPLIVTIGRLHPAKGIDRVAAAWATHPALHSATNLVV
ncbi:MAG: sucrose synthase (sucrose-UDP glucosyltransferase), partial [Acidimicrobiia bacterium]|nr:sucrose synthase (sucrose-UDP glucosyltransferase) [Acidimicrobiia bacterium]